MQLLLSFMETPVTAGSAPVWTILDQEQRSGVVAALARLIAKVAMPDDEGEADEKEAGDE